MIYTGTLNDLLGRNDNLLTASYSNLDHEYHFILGLANRVLHHG